MLNPLPTLLQTPSGLALLELQGTINLPDGDVATPVSAVPVGRLDFPDYHPDSLDPSSTAWMKRVYLFVGQHQRLTGEVKKLPKPIAVVRRRGSAEADDDEAELAEQLEVVEIVKYKLVFSQRPEPVGTASAVP
jgi:chromosome transmission fidelity protein 8